MDRALIMIRGPSVHTPRGRRGRLRRWLGRCNAAADAGLGNTQNGGGRRPPPREGSPRRGDSLQSFQIAPSPWAAWSRWVTALMMYADAAANADEASALRSEVFRLRAENREAHRRLSELSEAVAARDAFIATAGHELRNAMSGVLVAATNLYLRANRTDGVPDWVTARLEMIARQSRGFIRRATTLLDVSRLTACGGVRLTPAKVRLGDVFDVAVAELGAEAEVAGCPIDVALEGRAFGLWDREALEQIVVNLVSNAIKYGAGKPVHVSASVEGNEATIAVRDQGPGISHADRERIFAQFERALRPEGLPGFGMGLWIARQLVRAHGGELEVESVPGQGSVFTARLPGVIHEPHR